MQSLSLVLRREGGAFVEKKNKAGKAGKPQLSFSHRVVFFHFFPYDLVGGLPALPALYYFYLVLFKS